VSPQIVQRAQASSFCQEQLRRIEVERSGDVRLDRHLFRACSADIRRFCKDIEPGGCAEGLC
jgi:Golgi apparatus protein 1